MTITAIIAEYNPFHLGHKYHIEQAKKLTNADIILVIMSGNYVQRGEPAIFDKHLRSHISTNCGADIVIELPYPYSCASAEYFADSAVSILNKLGCIDYLCFGSECDDIDALYKIADILTNETARYKDALKEHLKSGLSYAKARHLALMSELNDDKYNAILSSPNNILGIEYIKSIKKLNSNIKPISIKRIESSYHHEKGNNPLYSASSIREEYLNSSFNNDDLSTISDEYNNNELYPVFLDDYSKLLLYKLIEYRNNPLDIFDISSDLSDRIINNVDNFTTFTEFIKIIKSKNTNYSSISRALMNIILSQTKESISQYKEHGYCDFARVLAINKNGKKIFKYINKDFKLLTKMSKAENELNSLPEYNMELYKKSLYADDLYRMIVKDKYNVMLPNEFQRKL
ncbi:MAG: nucleotidyltransferase family protein [Lachnospiraceae bacterium]|nr:nucleotidyltransferase family protein [Lachnospiraceae bacterium]